jgi:hypothetical protein
VRFHDKYYMFLTGGMVWVSDDLVTWQHEESPMPSGHRSPTAPNFFEYNGAVYLSGNGSALYKASSPLGPWTTLGASRMLPGRRCGCLTR